MDPQSLRYTEQHEWIGEDEGLMVVGITSYAQEQLGDITFIDLPAVGTRFEAMDEAAAIESVKAASDIYCPVAGVVAEVNVSLESAPEIVNKDPYGAGWIFKLEGVESEALDALMDSAAYQAHLAKLGD